MSIIDPAGWSYCSITFSIASKSLVGSFTPTSTLRDRSLPARHNMYIYKHAAPQSRDSPRHWNDLAKVRFAPITSKQ
ncbi:unnamed protein product [Fusarium graminearum]|uniref:Chromosome 2, complete genome n=2 Tax=Gibberella zeae TaxID=5518 RepID=A0A098DN93_GIBZE|nr:unnamed protein product [Fusarium graminearum]CAF3537605.1 unnamed protein product [Fusarium graminearum]CAG1975183.1 unnamed protein product [Fusarium graminearum]CAG1981652.1 unnamed protein product [Fusarium graminearum]CAG1999858.1 unnamed protein product [Fusarium graminearum]